jgi:hypothetical protein
LAPLDVAAGAAGDREAGKSTLGSEASLDKAEDTALGEDTVIRGSCLCQAIRYEIRGPVVHMAHCHCSMCRRWHGTAFGTYAIVKRPGLHWIAGEELLTKFASSDGVERGFCSRCGSKLTWESKQRPQFVELCAGALDDDPGVRPADHIWVASKAPWHEITDPLPQHDEERTPS